MAQTVRGVQPLAWGTQTITGYVVESHGDNETTEEVEIADEIGDIVTHVTNFGKKVDVSLEVIPKSSVSAPAVGDVLTYGSSKCVILAIDKKRVNKDVEKWSIKGKRHPGISLS